MYSTGLDSRALPGCVAGVLRLAWRIWLLWLLFMAISLPWAFVTASYGLGPELSFLNWPLFCAACYLLWRGRRTSS